MPHPVLEPVLDYVPQAAIKHVKTIAIRERKTISIEVMQ